MKANHRVAINLCTLIKQYLFILSFLSFGVGNKNAGRKFFKQQKLIAKELFSFRERVSTVEREGYHSLYFLATFSRIRFIIFFRLSWLLAIKIKRGKFSLQLFQQKFVFLGFLWIVKQSFNNCDLHLFLTKSEGLQVDCKI